MNPRDLLHLRLLRFVALGLGVVGGMLLGTHQLRSQFPWSHPTSTFWSAFSELACLPLTGYNGVGMVLGFPLLAVASTTLYILRKTEPLVSAIRTSGIALVTGVLWMHIGDFVASIGV